MTVRYAAIRLLTYRPESDEAFDRRHGTNTAGRVVREDLGIGDKATEEAAVLYLPSPAGITRRILRSLDVDYRDYAFVDIGCGKGRVCLVASEFPFRSVMGVDISAALCEVARSNLSRYRNPRQRCHEIEFRCADAREFPLPDGDIVFHFYHPFDEFILREVLQNIARSSRDDRRRILIVYLYCIKPARDVIEGSGFFRLVAYNEVVNPQYTWAVFSNQPSERP